MATLYTKTKLYIEANSKTWDDTKVSLQNNSDGNGDFIVLWSYDGLAKPTFSYLINVASTSDYFEIYAYHSASISASGVFVQGGATYTYFNGYKIIT